MPCELERLNQRLNMAGQGVPGTGTLVPQEGVQAYCAPLQSFSPQQGSLNSRSTANLYRAASSPTATMAHWTTMPTSASFPGPAIPPGLPFRAVAHGSYGGVLASQAPFQPSPQWRPSCVPIVSLSPLTGKCTFWEPASSSISVSDEHARQNKNIVTMCKLTLLAQ